MRVIDEEKRGTGRTLRLIFRALSYAGERRSVQVITADGQSAHNYCKTLMDIANAYHFPDILDGGCDPNMLQISGTVYEFISLSNFDIEAGYRKRATILIDHWALEQMEEGEKLEEKE